MSEQFGKGITNDGVENSGNIFLGLLGGLVAAVIGSAIWMGITLATNMHLGLVAIGVGALVGIAVRIAGHGSSIVFGIIGGVLTALSCLTGEVFTAVQSLTSPQHDFLEVLKVVDLGNIVSSVLSHTTPMSYIIYGIGVYEGFKFAIKK